MEVNIIRTPTGCGTRNLAHVSWIEGHITIFIKMLKLRQLFGADSFVWTLHVLSAPLKRLATLTSLALAAERLSGAARRRRFESGACAA